MLHIASKHTNFYESDFSYTFQKSNRFVQSDLSRAFRLRLVILSQAKTGIQRTESTRILRVIGTERREPCILQQFLLRFPEVAAFEFAL